MLRKFRKFDRLFSNTSIFIDIASITAIDEQSGFLNETASIVRTIDGFAYTVKGHAETHKREIEEGF